MSLHRRNPNILPARPTARIRQSRSPDDEIGFAASAAALLLQHTLKIITRVYGLRALCVTPASRAFATSFAQLARPKCRQDFARREAILLARCANNALCILIHLRGHRAFAARTLSGASKTNPRQIADRCPARLRRPGDSEPSSSLPDLRGEDTIFLFCFTTEIG
jgi:hypothetical protein